MKKQTIIALGLGTLVLASTAAVYSCWPDANELTTPISVSDVSALADGGSLAMTVRGANGKELIVARKGSLSVEPLSQSLALGCWCLGLPLNRDIADAPEQKRAVAALLDSWLTANVPAVDLAKLRESKEVPGLRAEAHVIHQIAATAQAQTGK